MTRPTSLPRLGLILVVTCGLVVVAAACGSDTATTATTAQPSSTSPTTVATADTSAPTTAPASTTTEVLPPGEVRIRDYEFVPPTITIAVGDTVTWTNNDDVDHWVLADDGTTFDSGALAQGATYVATPTAPGTYAYYCDIHNAMTGTIVVA